MSKIEVTLPEDLDRYVREQVEAGVYEDAGDMLATALELLRADPTGQVLSDDQKFAFVRAEIAKGLEDVAAGRVVDADFERIIGEAKARRAARLGR